LRIEDAPSVQLYAGDLDVARMLAVVPHPYPDGEAEAFIAELLEEPQDALPMRVFAIEHGGACIGTIGVTSESGFAEDPVGLGYWIGKPYWGRGLMTEAAREILRAYVFGALGRQVVRSGMFADNPASWRIQEKLGFERIGEAMKASLARGCDAPHWETRLTRARFEASAS
jgi:RimJ/RimL family protein N-acetyltransferase